MGFYCAVPDADAGRCAQREHDLREVFNGLRYIVRGGISWRMVPNDLPPWEIVYQQTQRWIAAGVFEAMVHDLRELLRMAEGRAPIRQPRSSTAARCKARLRVEIAAATMEPSGRRDRRFTLPSTPWDIC